VSKIPNADAWADARRMFRWPRFLLGFLPVIVFAVALRQLGQPDLEPTGRILWLLLPVPVLAWAVWEQVAQPRRLGEFERTVSARAAEISHPLTIAWLAFVALLATAFGFPIAIPAPFGLPPEEFGWTEVLLISLLLHMAVFVLVHKRLSGQQ
jgi:hypothetical protein